MQKRRREKKGKPQLRERIGFSTLKIDLAGQLKRSRTTVDKWILLAIRVNKDFAAAYLYQYEKFGNRVPLNPYQVYVLRAVSNFQSRDRDPKNLKTDNEILEFIQSQNFSLSSFLESIPTIEETAA